ncbi:hypothetical protein P7K49_029302 [Saguinus oedipus]|uniref:Uncharacterized protein n=1 Tax=Saguinus oedipus TaxID=9490 RepID=A0ABQ9U6T7_SAGOE|nr:hypothetical protein P7K49_029302 [Saguinus oedipus]
MPASSLVRKVGRKANEKERQAALQVAEGFISRMRYAPNTQDVGQHSPGRPENWVLLLWAIVPGWCHSCSHRSVHKSSHKELIGLSYSWCRLSNCAPTSLKQSVASVCIPEILVLIWWLIQGSFPDLDCTWTQARRPHSPPWLLPLPVLPGRGSGGNFVNQTSPLLSLQVEILPQGRETPIFKQFFKDWK